jgi:carboxylate-amine ligase
MVDRQTGQLSPRIHTILEKGHSIFGEQIKAEMLQSMVEINSELTWLNKNNLWAPMLSCHFIEENKWHAMRSGLDAEVIDFAQGRRLTMRDSVSELLDFVDEVVDELGSRPEMNYLRGLLEDPRGTGADRQIALYQETGSIDDVIQFLMQQTMQEIALAVA